MSARRRLDFELVRRGLVAGRSTAREVIEAGRVTVDGAPAGKPSRLVDPGQAVTLTAPPPKHVSRGGRKLEAALERFKLNPGGLAAVDIGASTGGFTDCLLQCGASSVAAVDVGRGQLHQKLRNDSRVSVFERTNVRGLQAGVVGGPFDLLVADLSFISLRKVMSDLVGLVIEGAPMVLLVKPQFEAGKAEVDRGNGVVRDPTVWLTALDMVDASIRMHGAAIMDGMPSPITGADGNVEFLILVHTAVDPVDVVILDSAALVHLVGKGLDAGGVGRTT